MSTAKRSKRRQPEAKSASPLPSSKRLKTSKAAHVPAAQSGLGFLVDEDARHGKKLDARLTNGVPGLKNTRLDESRAVIAPTSGDDHEVGVTQATAIDISSAEESSGDDEDEQDAGGQQNGASAERSGQRGLVNGHASRTNGVVEFEHDAVAGAEDTVMADNEDEEEMEEPSFGDMLKARHPEPVDVHAAFPNPMADRQALTPTSAHRVLSVPSGTSLGTVLTQALKTNDKDLLESCFQTTDLPSIRSTIQRLQSQHVASLLQRLAERIHKRPGRTGTLMVWVQWSLVAHGGFLATQPDLVKKLKSLSQVIRDRANGLQPLIRLKGKLDMLNAQLDLRRTMQAASRAANAKDDDEEDGVIYVEGQHDDWSDSGASADEEEMDPPMLHSSSQKPGTQEQTLDVNGSTSDDDSEDAEDMPNGVGPQKDGDSSEAEEDEPGMFDIEAEVTDDDEDDEEEDSDEEGDSDADPDSEADVSDDESEASGVTQPKPTVLHRKR